jgi:hypothetical protein
MKLSNRIGQKASDSAAATGVYIEINNVRNYVDEVKESILGNDLTETFDTLKEIADWIEGPGVNATELSQAVAVETTNRIAADAEIYSALEGILEQNDDINDHLT